MIKLYTSAATPGMILAKPIYTKEGRLLIDREMVLKEFYIEKLKRYSINHIYIYWSKSSKPEIQKIITEETRTIALTAIKDAVTGIHMKKEMDIQKLQTAILRLTEELMEDRGILLNLTDIRSIDEYTFGHCVNVCVLALIMGIALEYEKKDLQILGLGALLHDIGKVNIRSEILTKPGALTEEEYKEMKKHTLYGYQVVGNLKGLKEEVSWIIRDHHERFDGKGYPSGLIGKQIHEFSRIVAICDVYDALTSHRVYRPGIPPHDAIEYLITMGYHQFDCDLVKIFLKQISIYPVGTLVKLRSGEEGIVVNSHEDFPTRPVVRVLRDALGNPIEIRKNVDLTEQLNNGIVDILKAV
ncbi:metal dependent phosphohydrolase [Clostridium aceticum]|uniref:Metal dependent phosphohydrolase n=1 Tax=Clostridium aceticum TaxID=84022 RepID=A0A0D8IE55_9CLOT|nr:HD-GYP domain-containing protein [Clostridium aceticum]AKL96701.1 metal dependent phosphohydrolase [Clostridium aceticum]KJF27471.1 hypothetical protein TZ02_06655 [Clostridium aceticum]